MPDPIRYSGAVVDLSPRVSFTKTVAGSPALAAETIVASLTLSQDVAVASGVLLNGWLAVTIGTAGVSAQVKIRRTNASGTTIVDSGAVTAVAADLRTFMVRGFDTGPTLPGQVYVLTLQIASGGAVSTVSATQLDAIIV